MNIHQPSGRWKLGLALTLVTSLSWAAQPIAMSILVAELKATTLAFYKLFSATVVLTAILVVKKRIPKFKVERKKTFLFLFLAAAGLACSYVFFATSFLYISPGNTELYIQSARILFILAGVFLFKESFEKPQWSGLGILSIGFYLFYQNQITHQEKGDHYFLGVVLVLAAAVTWVVYAIFQKLVLNHLSSQQSLVCIYIFSSIFLSPYAELEPLLDLSVGDMFLLAFICLSNLVSFACFSEALNHWEASRVSATISLTPIYTFGLAAALSALFPGYILRPEHITWVSMLGALLVTIGSALVCFYKRSE